MPESAWKRTERDIAAYLSGQRIPITGRQRGDVPDIAHPDLSIEVKRRRTLPAWILEAMAQAEAAQRDGQLPVVVLRARSQRVGNALAVMRLEDLKALLGP